MGCRIGVETPPGFKQVAYVLQAMVVGNWRGYNRKPVLKLSKAVGLIAPIFKKIILLS